MAGFPPPGGEAASGKSLFTPFDTYDEVARTLLERLHMSAIHLKIRVGDQTLLRTFERLPIRIGRDPSNECQLDFPSISRVHARLDRCGDRLALFDEGSCNGTFVGGLLVRPGAPVVLEQHESSFDLEKIHVRVHVETHPHTHPDANATRGYEDGGVDPIALFRRKPGDDQTAHAALQSLRELATSLAVPGLSLDDPARVTAFVQRLDEVLRVFLDSFVALRFACRAETGAADPFDQSSSSARGRFLDWTATEPRAATVALEEAALEIVRRQAQLSEDARRAAHTIAHLAPEAIESAVGRKPLTVFGVRRLWNEFRRRHDELCDELADARNGPSVSTAGAARAAEISGIRGVVTRTAEHGAIVPRVREGAAKTC